MRLLDLSDFHGVFAPLTYQRVGIVDGVGNPGDRLLDLATRQLLREFRIEYFTVNILCDNPRDYDLDVLLLAAGGSMGGPPCCQEIRRRAVASGIPCWVLPQSFHAPEDCSDYDRVYVREPVSQTFCESAILAPDLALGYDFPDVPPPHLGEGVFLRGSGHSAFPYHAKIDPAAFCYTPEDYIAFVAQYESIVTDRLHLAITALGIGRDTTLLPVTYHKNRAMWEQWLGPLGCWWRDQP